MDDDAAILLLLLLVSLVRFRFDSATLSSVRSLRELLETTAEAVVVFFCLPGDDFALLLLLTAPDIVSAVLSSCVKMFFVDRSEVGF